MNRARLYARVCKAFLMTLAIAALASCSGGDGDDGGGGGGGNGGGGPDRNVTAVWGTVRAMGGAGLSGVTVAVGGATTQTNQFGDFEIDATAGPAVVRFSKDGFLPQVERVTVLDGKATAVETTMRPFATPVTLNATDGGTATGDRGAALAAAAGALVDAAGNPVTGDVDVHLTPFDPSDADELAALPGELEAQTAAGDRAVLESFGVLDVTVMQGGQELGVADGQTVTIRIPAPEGVADPPETIPIWSFDEEQGIWVEEGTGTYLAAEGVYEAEITHFSYWNADKVAEATCVKGVILGEDGDPVPGAHVVAGGVDYIGSTSATADENGAFCVAVRKNSTIRITASDGDGGLVQQEVQSGGGDTTVPPDCGSPDCLDVGSFTIDRLTCEEVGNPWEGTCAADMGGMLTCFQPSGSCTVSMSGVEWENGARVELDDFGMDGSGTGRYIGANGETCGTFEFSGTAAGGGGFSGTFTVNGQDFRMSQDDETGTLTITCPNGETVEMTREQMEAYEACSAEEAQESCAVDTGGGGGGGGLCSGDGDCTGDDVCCDYSGTSICLPQATCDAMQDFSTGCGDGCPGGQECCEITSGFSQCVPQGSCPN